ACGEMRSQGLGATAIVKVLGRAPWRRMSRSSQGAKLVRHHRPPDMFMHIAGEGLGVGERVADAAEIDVEILSPRRPIRAEQAEKIQFVLDAAADRKSGLAMGERCVAGRLGDALLDFPKGAAAGGIEQGRSDRVAKPTAHSAEPGELLI